MIHPEERPTGLILAGGRSRRFGADKALYRIDGISMIERVYDALSKVANPVFISTAAASKYYYLPVRHLADTFEDAGPLAGIHAGLKSAPTPWMLVSAVDLPFIDEASFRTITAHISDELDAIVAGSGDRIQPLLGCYRKTLVESLESHISRNRLSAKQFAQEIGAKVVELPAPVLRNINRMEDLP